MFKGQEKKSKNMISIKRETPHFPLKKEKINPMKINMSASRIIA